MHKKRCIRFLASLLAVSLLTTTIVSNSLLQISAQQDQAVYEIYPNPHDISYEDGSFIISSQVNIVAESGIDEATKNKILSVLTQKGITGVISDKEDRQKTNVLLGIHGSSGYVDSAMSEMGIDQDLFNKISPYYMNVANNTISILGGDSDAVFYGITTLNHILNQMDGKQIQSLTVEDYADTKTRGFIEGYYGIPWTNEDRMSLMRFGGEMKMTSYIFAPKDDPYHSARWRDLYPEDKLADIAEMAAVGNESKCRFVWTIHPFMNGGITEATYDSDIAKIEAKFDQLYNAGVRQFGVLGDDAGNLPRSIVIRVMKDLQAWVDGKGDVFNLVFCPGGYNNSWWKEGELDEYDAGFDEDIQIFWTGESVCAPVSQNTLDNFRRRALPAGNDARRSPLFWLNWPVNDINMSRLMMGKGSLLHTDVNIDDLSGVVTNPMQDAEPSKVAIFAIGDYAWNVKDFDEDQSWEDSFKYIDEDASDSLYTLAKHMSDPAPNGHGLVLEESEEIKPLLDAFLTAYDTQSGLNEAASALMNAYDEIIAACDDYQAESKNERMKEQLLPFSNSLRDLSEASIAYIQTAIALNNNDVDQVWRHYSQAQALVERSKSYDHMTLSGSQAALPGSKRLRPFVDKLSERLAGPVGSLIDETKVIVTPITSRSDSPSQAIANMVDGSASTYAQWQSPNSAKTGDYIGVSFSRSILLNDIEFLMSDSATSNKNTFKTVKLQYTEDGKQWVDLNDKTYGNKAITIKEEGLNVTVKGVRVVATEDTPDIWLACREIIYNKADQPEQVAKPLVIKSSNLSYYAGNDSNLLDKDDSTFGWFQPNAAKDDFVGVDLQNVIDIDSVRFVMGSGGDYWKDYELQYSLDGNTYTTLKSYTQSEAQKIVEENVSASNIQARYVRLLNKSATNMWTKICELDVRQKAKGSTIYTNREDLKNVVAFIDEEHSYIEPKAGIALDKGDYIGLKLSRIRNIDRIETSVIAGLTLQVSDNEVIWNDVTDMNDVDTARYIRYINNSDKAMNFDLNAFHVYSNEIQPISVESTTFGDQGSHLNMFDNDRTTEAILQNSQTVGQYITYDLGQTINLNSLKIVAHDSTTDFPRHAKISVSNDLENWESIMLLGNQDSNNPGEVEDTDSIQEILPDHEISYNTKSVRDLNVNARYIKFEITRNKAGADKWVRFRELEINDGEYIPETNDPTITTTSSIAKGYTPANLIDGDVSTVFKPVDNEDGNLVYKLSNVTDFNKLSIFQSPTQISNADVSVLAIGKTKGGEPEWVSLGQLSASINEFNLKSFQNILAVKIAWVKDALPVLHEITTLRVTSTDVDKGALETAFNEAKAVDSASWTPSSVETLQNAMAKAQLALANDYTTQAMVNSARSALTTAIDQHKVKGDIEKFKADVTTAIKNVKAEENYLSRTWGLYVKALTTSNAAMTSNELTNEELTAVLATLNQAVEQLTYEVNSIEELTLFVNSLDQMNDADYTATSLHALKEAMNNAQAMIVADLENRQDPQLVKAMHVRLQTAVNNVVSIAELNSILKEVEAIDGNAFTTETYHALMDAVNAGKALMSNGTAQDIANAVANIQTAISNLVAVDGRTSKQILGASIKKAQGLIENNMLDNVNEKVLEMFNRSLENAVRVYAKTDATDQEFMDAWSKLANAMHYLDFTANTIQLRALLEECATLDLNNYVDDEHMAEYKAAKEHAQSVLDDENSLDASLTKAYNRLSSAKSNLVLKDDQIDTIAIDFMIHQGNAALRNEAYYNTAAESWNVFKIAYNDAVKARADMASQAAIDEAANALGNAYTDIRLIANEDTLGELADYVSKIDTINVNEYSAETMTFFMETRAVLQQMIEAEKFTMAEYDSAVARMAEVERRMVEDKLLPSEPTAPNEPDVPSEPTEPNEPVTPENTNKETSAPAQEKPIVHGTTKPATGDATQAGMLMVSLLGAGIAASAMARRRRK